MYRAGKQNNTAVKLSIDTGMKDKEEPSIDDTKFNHTIVLTGQAAWHGKFQDELRTASDFALQAYLSAVGFDDLSRRR